MKKKEQEPKKVRRRTFKRYRVDATTRKIEAVRVVRENRAYVYLPIKGSDKNRRERRVSAYVTYHNTWESAHDYLVKSVFHKINNLVIQLKLLRVHMDEVEKMEDGK